MRVYQFRHLGSVCAAVFTGTAFMCQHDFSSLSKKRIGVIGFDGKRGDGLCRRVPVPAWRYKMTFPAFGKDAGRTAKARNIDGMTAAAVSQDRHRSERLGTSAKTGPIKPLNLRFLDLTGGGTCP